MRKAAFVPTLFFAALLLASLVPAVAGPVEVTNPTTVYLLYHKMLNRSPDFDEIAKMLPVPKDVSALDHDNFYQTQRVKLVDAFNALDTSAPLHVLARMKLSPYDQPNSRMTLIALYAKTAFHYQALGMDYCLTTINPEEFHNLNMTYDDAQRIYRVNGESLQFNVEFTLLPVIADGKDKHVYDEKPCFMIATRIVGVRLWAGDTGPMVWNRETSDSPEAGGDLFDK